MRLGSLFLLKFMIYFDNTICCFVFKPYSIVSLSGISLMVKFDDLSKQRLYMQTLYGMYGINMRHDRILINWRRIW